jgi:ankyrin repeat protein
LLLDKGADLNALGGIYENALHAASKKGHKEIEELLIEKGAEVNAQRGRYINALQVASARGHEEVIKVFLNEGVIVNREYAYILYTSALATALENGQNQVVELLSNKVSRMGPIYNTQGRRVATETLNLRIMETMVAILVGSILTLLDIRLRP